MSIVDNRTVFLNALRSGNYKKGKTKLRRQLVSGAYEYCALGVLWDVARPKGKTWVDMIDVYHDGSKILGIPKHAVDGIWHMNDQLALEPTYNEYFPETKWSFSEIADFLETKTFAHYPILKPTIWERLTAWMKTSN